MNEGLNKRALADVVAEKYDITKKASGEIINLVFAEIIASLEKGESVEISGFGKFSVKVREARKGINPHTKERIDIKATKMPVFKASKALKELVK